MGALANGIKVNGLETHCCEHCRLMGLQGGALVFARNRYTGRDGGQAEFFQHVLRRFH